MTQVLNTATIIGSGTKRQLIATVLSDGQSHLGSSIMRRTGSSYDGMRGRISELRSRNGLVIENVNGSYTLRGIQV